MSRPPNIIWIFGDQHRAQATGYAGDPNVHTPNLDAFASYALNFRCAVSGSPLCCPFRGALLTGRYPHQNGVVGHQEQLPAQPTVAHAFAAHGYRTSYFGKWHLDGFEEWRGRAAQHVVPRERRGGFEDWVGYENNNAQFDAWVHGHYGAFTDTPTRLEGFETDALTDLFLDYLDERGREQSSPDGGRPFFAALSVQPPHDPYTAPEEWMRRHTPGGLKLRANVPAIPGVEERARRELAGYYALIENLDWNFGRILARLRESGLADHTHILFFSDHGDCHGSQGQFRKTTYLEESIRVPCLIGSARGPYGFRCGSVDHPLNHVDYAPTSLGLAGLPVPEGMVGHDYSTLRRRGVGQESPEPPDSAFLQIVRPTGHADSLNRAWRGIVTRDHWKLVCLEGQALAMHRLDLDPYEQMNLAFNSAYASDYRRLRDRLARWIEETGDEFRLPD